MSNAISFDQIDAFRKELAAKPASDVVAKAVQNVGPKATIQSALHDEAVTPVFSVELDTGAVANQKHSGRCWLFSGLNTMRHAVAKKIGVKDLEFSQAFLAFYDRLEKSNLFLEAILTSADKPLDDRALSDLLSQPNGDGGQFDNAPALIAKYGIVPKSVMPETYNSENTTELNSVLNLKLRKDASDLRTAFGTGASADTLAATKQAMLSDIYRILAYAYGTVPATFDFEYRDDKKEYHIDRDLTPKSFYEKYVGWDLAEFVTLVSTPEAGKEYYQAYTIPSQNTVVGGRPIIFVNVPEADLKEAAIAQLQGGEAVWFGNDVLQDMERKSGALKGGLYDFGQLFDLDLTMDKATRFATGEAEVSHAMTLTGVDLVDGQPRRWKVENSWGKENGNDGYYIADANWFDDYVYEAAINKEYLSEKILAAAATTPIELPSWDSLH
ncbi:C1 family peptidase [Lacticaseibacillus yichunensis]|uniref:Aminopeptidase n=1 Tax=Lacticaseibacillus yichunensis TaxID=2486015 RepID=A0ABW4CP77_9LACO|nr:C1 family peptidase [Lacticaseibacillus yichunensis]